MQFKQKNTPLALDNIHDGAVQLKKEGARYVQILAVNNDDFLDLVYTFMNSKGELCNYNVDGVAKDATIESITDSYFEAFVCENEIHSLFGPTFSNLALDFGDNFYTLSAEKPMTIISPEELARREKEKKIAAAKAAAAAKKAKEAKAAKEAENDVLPKDLEANRAAKKDEGGASDGE